MYQPSIVSLFSFPGSSPIMLYALYNSKKIFNLTFTKERKFSFVPNWGYQKFFFLPQYTRALREFKNFHIGSIEFDLLHVPTIVNSNYLLNRNNMLENVGSFLFGSRLYTN